MTVDPNRAQNRGVLAQSIELTQGVVLAAILAVAGPLAVIGAGFIAWGRLRQTVDDLRVQVQKLTDADAAHAERLRGELNGHAIMLGDRIDAAEKAARSARRELWDAVRSLQRWRERLRGREDARRGSTVHPVPTPVHGTGIPHYMPPDQTTDRIDIPSPNPHRSSAEYPGLEESSED